MLKKSKLLHKSKGAKKIYGTMPYLNTFFREIIITATAGLEVRAPELLVLKMSLKLFLVQKYLVILMYFTVFKTCENMQGDNKLNIQKFN